MYQRSLPLNGSSPTARPLSRLFSSPHNETERFRLRVIDRLRPVESALWLRLESRVEFLFDLLEVPVSYISVIDENDQYFLSARGLDVGSVDRSKTPDHRLLYDRERNRIQDTIRTASESYRYLREKFGWRSHASVPLHGSEGFVLGSVGVADRNPRSFESMDFGCLREVSEEVAGVLENQQRDYSGVLSAQHKLKI